MGYELFAQKKIVLISMSNTCSLMQAQRNDEQMSLATHTTALQQQLSNIQVAQGTQLAELYRQLAAVSDSDGRARINAQIQTLQAQFDVENQEINNQIYRTSMKENIIEMEVKRIETLITSIQKEIESVDDAISNGIDRATPKYNGLG